MRSESSSPVRRSFKTETSLVLFTGLPRLGVVGNSAVMNVEPVFALVLAWLILGQRIAPVQVVGALVVVGAVMWLGTRKK